MKTRGGVLLAVFALCAALPAESLLADVGRWSSSGPNGAPVLDLAASPGEPSTVYLATARRVYKSRDAGRLWEPTGLSGFFNLILTTSTPSILYAAALDGGGRIYRTIDGGETWLGTTAESGRLDAAAVDRSDPMTLYAATNQGILVTRDGGASWQRLTSVPARVSAITVDPVDPTVLYAGTLAGVYRSPDRGTTWIQTPFRNPTFKLLFDPGDDSRLLALTGEGLQVTTNRGQSWRRLARTLLVPTDVAIDPADSRRLYVVSAGAVFSSSDGGETTTQVHAGNVGPITVSGSSVVLVGAGTGVYRSEDAGQGWTSQNTGIRETSVRSLALDPTNSSVVFVGTANGIYRSRDGGGSWDAAISGSPAANVIAIDPANPSTLYAAGRGSGVQKSIDGGQSWQKKSPANMLDYVASLVIDPNDARRVFAAYGHVSRSRNGAESWEDVLRVEDDVASYYYPPEVSAMAIAPSDSATVYAGGAIHGYSAGFVSSSRDGGTTWSAPAILGSPVLSLAVDPCDPGMLYAGTNQGVYRSVDDGATWIEPRFFQSQVFSLVVDPRQSSSVFAGTALGLYWTIDSGDNWTRFEPFLSTSILSLAIDSSGRFLHAGTGDAVFDLERTFEPCAAGGKNLCLLGARFELQVTARDTRSGVINSIDGQGVPDGDRFGYFSFPALTGDASFPEVFVKMADAEGQPAPYGNNVWVFHTSLTALDYTLTVRDTFTGRVRTYDSQKFGFPPAMACGVADTRAFDGACSARTHLTPLAESEFSAVSASTLFLLGGRFRATLRATDPRTSRTVEGEAIARADGFGYFSLPGFTGDSSFPEVFVKMTDGTAAPGNSYWVFHSGLTDVDYTLTVTDQVTGAVKSYRPGAPTGGVLCGQADTSAFRN